VKRDVLSARPELLDVNRHHVHLRIRARLELDDAGSTRRVVGADVVARSGAESVMTRWQVGEVAVCATGADELSNSSSATGIRLPDTRRARA
jgi:hypothetical protein